MKPRVLLATPVFDDKEYAIGEWIARSATYTHPHETLLVDNSVTPEFFERWRKEIAHLPLRSLVRIEVADRGGTAGNPTGMYFRPLAQAAEFIRQYALAHNFDYWLNLDVDEFGEPDLIDYLLDLMMRERVFHDGCDVLNHASPNRQLTQFIEGGFGCVLFRRNVLQVVSFNECPNDVAHDVWFYRRIAEINARLEADGPAPELYHVKATRGTRVLEHWDGKGDQRITAFDDGRPYVWTQPKEAIHD